MNTCDRRLLMLLREALRVVMNPASAPRFDSELFRMTDGEWHELLRQSADQGVLALAWDGLGALPRDLWPSRKIVMQWAANVDGVERNYSRKREAAASLFSLYREHGINVMIIKGLGLCSLYPHPNHRAFSDIDIWLYGEQERADEILRRECGVEISGGVHHHTTFRWQGVAVENHYDFINVHSHASSAAVEAELKRLARLDGEPLDIDGQAVRTPAPEFNALFLMKHMGSHFAAVRIGLQHVVDWALFLARYGETLDRERMVSLYRKIGIYEFACAVTSAAVEWLGLPAEAAICLTDDKALTDRVLGDILHAEFSDVPEPGTGLLGMVIFKTRRWWANRWKHRLVYDDSLVGTFFRSSFSHLLKPQSIKAN